MKNEFGAVLDSNGYAPSIIPDHSETRCFICDRGTACARHEIYHSHYGANRDKAKALGLWVYLCPDCHYALHNYGDGDKTLKEIGQSETRRRYGWDAKKFRQEFGKNYLKEEE